MKLSEKILVFLDVIECGSISKAAEKRFLDRSAVSKQVKQLESELGLQLLNREGRQVTPTLEAVNVLELAQHLRTSLNEVKKIANSDKRDTEGTLRLSSESHFGRQVLQGAIEQFYLKHPDIRIDLQLDNLVGSLVAGGFDLGIRLGFPKNSNMIQRKLMVNKPLIVASPQFITQYGLPQKIEDLTHLPAICYGQQGMIQDHIMLLDEQQNPYQQACQVQCSCNDLQTMIDLAKEGLGYSVVAAIGITDEILDGKLIPLLTDVQLGDYGAYYLIYPHRELSKKVQLFIDELFDYIGNPLDSWKKNIPGFEDFYGCKES